MDRWIQPDEYFEAQIAEAVTLRGLVEPLQALLANHSVWKDGRLLFIKKLVENVNGLRIEIYHKEHAPPHFHVVADGLDASFTIQECHLLHGQIDGRERRIVEWWHARSREKLIRIWNDTRPADCPVGPIAA